MFKVQKTVSPFKDFQLLSKLGEGAYSTVFKALRKSDNLIYALKKVKIDDLNDKEKDNALNEVRILASISDPFIIAYKEAFFDEDSNNLCIIMEYAEQGDLQKKIKDCQNMKKYIPEREIWKCLIHVSKALQTLHEQEILHRDLKSANVFISKDGLFKLGDMNVSKIANKGLVYTQTGTPYYASPEVWRDEPYDLKSDIWSLGCVLYEMAALKPPFQANDMSLLFKKVQSGTVEKIPSCYSKELFNIICLCLQVKPKDRPMASMILQLPDVLLHLEEVEGFHLVRKSSTRVNMLKKIEIPKNLAILKEMLPKPNYRNHWEAESDIEGAIRNQEKNSKIRVASAESHRAIFLKNTINPSLISEENKKNESPKPNNIGGNLSKILMNLNGPLVKSPLKHNPFIHHNSQKIKLESPSKSRELKLPQLFANVQKSPSNEFQATPVMNNKPANLNVLLNSRLHLNSQIAIHQNKINQNNNAIQSIRASNEILPSRNESGVQIQMIPKSIYQLQLEKQKIGLSRPSSQEIIQNNNSKLLKQIPSSPLVQNYKVILKNRPLSQNSERKEVAQVRISKEERELQISEEKDIGRITNKLRPFSCNSNVQKLETTKLPDLIKKENSPMRIFENHKNIIKEGEQINKINYPMVNINKGVQNQTPQKIIFNYNNRGLLHNQKPFSAPHVNRDALALKNNANPVLFSKQAIDMGGNLGQNRPQSIFGQGLIRENLNKLDNNNKIIHPLGNLKKY